MPLDSPAELKGLQTPPIESVPPYGTSAGDEAIELAATAGLFLDPWQQYVLRASLGERPDGKWSGFEVGLVVGRQNGKNPHSLDTPILTTAGWSDFGRISTDDHVYGPDGLPTRVVATSPVWTDEDCYRIAFSDGSSYVVGGGHLWSVKKKGKWAVLDTRTIATNYARVRPDNGRTEYRYRVTCDSVPETPKADLPIDPWLLGYWLGDGNKKSAQIIVGRQDKDWLLERLHLLGVRVVSVYLHRTGAAWSVNFRLDAAYGDGFQARCTALGLLRDKHIPEMYLTASPEQRRALLAGLMDSDGSIAITNRSPQVEFSTSHPRVAATFHRLARSLGIRTSPIWRATSRADNCRFMWTPNFNPFEMPRKADRWRPPSSLRHELMSVVNVERVATVPTRCISVERGDGLYLVGHHFTPTHNSIAEARELAGLFLFGEELIIHTAHLFKTAGEAFRRVRFLIENNPDFAKRVKSVREAHGHEGIELKSGQRLRFLARAKGSGRGFSGDCVIMDEAMYLDSAQMGDLMPTLSARPNAQLWYLSSAGNEESVHLGKVVRRGRSGVDPSLAYFEWCIDENDRHDDPSVWGKANPGLGIRITQEAIERELLSLDPIEFARERLGIGTYPVDSTAEWLVVSEGQWNVAEDRDSQFVGSPCFAVDVSPDRAWATIAAAGLRPDGHRHVEIIRHDTGTSWLPSQLKELVDRWKPGQVALDSSGPAGSIKADIKSRGVNLTDVTGRAFGQACGSFYNALVEAVPTVRHRGQAELSASMKGACKRSIGDGAWAWSRKDATVNLSPLIAATLALHAHSELPTPPQPGTRSLADFLPDGGESDFWEDMEDEW